MYGLYARNDITHPDGKTGVIYKAGSQICTLTTDKEGKARIENLYLGEYYIKEITPSVGYLADEHEYDLVCSDEGDLTAVVEKECTSLETVKKQPFELIKAANNGDTDAALLSGAGFSAYLVSSLVVKEDGNYDFSSAEPVVIGENGATEIFTNEKGYVKSIAIPYGTYLVRETTTPHNYKPVDDFIVRVTENKPTEPQTWRVLLDKEFSAKLKIIKQDDETKKSVLIPGTEFKIYDMDHEKYVEQVTTYPTTVTHTSYFTDIDGYLILPQNLKIGHYRIEEVTAPDGYTINKNYVEIQVDTNTLYQTDPVSGDVIIEVVYENHPVKGKLTVQKKGEVLSTYKNDFKYEVQNLSGAVYEVYAAEDIYTADFQKDDTGKRILEYAKGAKVAELTTDESGKADLDNLPLGEYKVVEKTAPEGFVLNEEEQKISFVYADQDTPVISQSAEFINDRQKVEVSVVKKDAENEKGLSGAEFGLYAKEDIKAGDEWTSGSTPHIIKELEVGKKYTLTETIPADGYATAESITFVVENTADIQKVEMQDDTTKILISKVDMTDGSSEVKGAKLYILNENQEVMESWTSGDQPHYVEKLPIGTYTLLEETAPKGYIVANKVTFEIKDTGDIQGAKMEDEQAMGKVILNKTDKDTKKPMKGVEFALCDSKGKVLETLVTDSAGHAESKNYPIATFKNGQYKKAITYILKETKTLDGYQLDETEHKIQFEYVNDRTPVIEYTLDLTNKKAPEKDTPETSENQGVSTPVSHGSDATSVSNSPKTGDNTNIAIFVLALAVSAGCLGTVVTVKRKRK